MRIEDFKWETLYEKADNFMKSIKANEYSIATNRMSVVNNEPIVEVCFPKRANAIAIMFLHKNNACIKHKGYMKDKKLFCIYDIYINRIK